MKRFVSVLGVLISSLTTLGQQVTDIISTTGYVQGLYIDHLNNTYILGEGGYPLVIDSVSLATPGFGPNTGFSYLIKLDSNKNVVWYNVFDTWLTSVNEERRIAVDDDLNVYVTTNYSQECNLGNFHLEANPAYNGNGRVTFKTDSMGNYLWAVNTGGTSIRYDSFGYVELMNTISYVDTVTGGYTTTNDLANVVRFDPDGNLINFFQMDDPNYENERLYGRDRDGNYFGHRREENGGYIGPGAYEAIKLDSAFNTIAVNHIYTTSSNDNPPSFVADMDNGGYYLVANTYDRQPLNAMTGSNLKVSRLIKLDENLNLTQVLNLGGPGGGGGGWKFLNIIDGDVFLGGWMSGGPISLGQPNYLYTASGTGIQAKFSNTFGLKWHREVPEYGFAANMFPAHSSNNGLVIVGHNGPFEIDGQAHTTTNSNTSNYSGAYLMYMEDFDSTISVINGNVFHDVDMNGVRTPTDVPAPYLPVTSSSLPGNYVYSSTNGEYQIAAVAGDQVIRSLQIPTYWSRSTPDSVLVNLSVTDSAIFDIDFGIYPIPGIQDLSIDIIPTSAARAGSDVSYTIEMCNHGTDTTSGFIDLQLAPFLTFVSSSITADSVVGNHVFFDFSDLSPNQCLGIDVSAYIATSVSIDTYLHQHVTAEPLANDSTPDDNYSEIYHRVTSSYDPNDISVFPSCPISEEFVATGKRLEYLIRFQNTGTDTAFAITIRDTLSSLLDLQSFRIESTADSVAVSMIGNELVLQFDNILLPDSGANIEASKGFFKYSIQVLPSASSGDFISNQVAIFFDFNAPIFTNEVTTSILPASELIEVSVTPASCVGLGSINIADACIREQWRVDFNNSGYVPLQTDVLDSLISGTYSLGLTNGFDTIVMNPILIDTISVFTANESTHLCQGDSLFVSGMYQSASGTYLDSLQTSNGCDSLHITQLIVHPEYDLEMIHDICHGDTIFLAGSYRTTSGVFVDSLQTGTGCDSTVTNVLNVWPEFNMVSPVFICKGDSAFINGEYESSAGLYPPFTYQSLQGCDSIVKINLVVDNASTNISKVGNTLTASENGNGITYQWITCDNSTPIPGAISRHYTATEDNEYAVIITSGNCSYQSECLSVVTSVSDLSDMVLGASPNPTTGAVSFRLTRTMSEISVKVISIEGKKVLESLFFSTDNFRINMPEIAGAGMYLVMIGTENGFQAIKIIKE